MVKKGSIYTQVVVPLLAEFTAQFIHTLWGVMASGPAIIETNSTDVGENSLCSSNDQYFLGVFVPALQAGLSVWMQIVVFWKISVVHFNPAISMGFLVSGDLKPIMFIPYVAIQCLASTFAAFLAKGIMGKNPSVIAVPDDVSSMSVFLNEAAMTGILVFFAVAMVVDKSYDQATGPLAIGLTVFQGILSAKWVGAACISPSRAFGPALVTGGAAWNRHWLLWLSDLTGAAIASAYFMFFFAPPNKSWSVWLRKRTSKKPRDTVDNKESACMVETDLS
ncbi:unnamed protein product [Clavelina lepadiformis]|uniref:Aquaporin n=1 Tax=Clavelina lepadiformis TaxID=159417 RepID=A0ABP0FWN1_CLALP